MINAHAITITLTDEQYDLLNAFAAKERIADVTEAVNIILASQLRAMAEAAEIAREFSDEERAEIRRSLLELAANPVPLPVPPADGKLLADYFLSTDSPENQE